MALLGHEAELHYHSLEPMASQKPQLALVQELKEKYGEGKITEEICPNCGKQFESYTHKLFFRAVRVERCRLIHMTAFSVTAASWRSFRLEL